MRWPLLDSSVNRLSHLRFNKMNPEERGRNTSATVGFNDRADGSSTTLSSLSLLFIENEEEKDKNARITDPFLLHLLMRLKKRSSDSVLASSFLFLANAKEKGRESET